MSPLKHSKNFAARMGRWSASHRKTAIFGWLAFVVASFAIGSVVGMKTIDRNDSNVGEARTADHIIPPKVNVANIAILIHVFMVPPVLNETRRSASAVASRVSEEI